MSSTLVQAARLAYSVIVTVTVLGKHRMQDKAWNAWLRDLPRGRACSKQYAATESNVAEASRQPAVLSPAPRPASGHQTGLRWLDATNSLSTAKKLTTDN